MPGNESDYSEDLRCNECGNTGASRQWEHRDINRDIFLCLRCEIKLGKVTVSTWGTQNTVKD